MEHRFTKVTQMGYLWMILVGLVGCQGPVQVDIIQPQRQEIREWFVEPAQTRLKHSYRITMPVDGRVARITWEPGDAVRRDQSLVELDRLPFEQAVVEARAAVAELEQELTLSRYDEIEDTAEVDLQTTIDAARDVLKATAAQVQAEQVRSQRAAKELQRIRELAKTQSVSPQRLDDVAMEADTAVIQLRERQFMQAAFNTLFTAIKLGPVYVDKWLGRKRLDEQRIKHRLIQARTRLARAEHQLSLALVQSPIDGVVLERYQRGDGFLSAGEPLLWIGNLQDLEVIAEVLTTDALRLPENALVELSPADRSQGLTGRVERIEPAGFTKLSSLGVEQQRVNVIVRLQSSLVGLGVGYRLQAKFFTGIQDDALVVPRFSVLQAPDRSFYIFRVVEDRLQRQPVSLGLGNDLELQILTGVSEQDRIVATPETTLQEGDKVTAAR